MNAQKIMQALRERSMPGCAFFEELRLNMAGERRIDAFMMSFSPTLQFRRTMYEIKISAADFKRELRNLSKVRQARLISNEFYYVAPAGVLKAQDIPDWAGFIEYHESTHTLTTRITAPRRESEPPTWDFIACILRRVHQLEFHSTAYVSITDAALSAVGAQGICEYLKGHRVLLKHVPELLKLGIIADASPHDRDGQRHYRIKELSRFVYACQRLAEMTAKGQPVENLDFEATDPALSSPASSPPEAD